MKLDRLYEEIENEYLDVAKDSHDFYGDPKSKAKPLSKSEDNLSFLTGGKTDRKRFLKKTNKKKSNK